MSQAIYQFPTGFLWGAATSSHQVEGNNKNNNWFAWENRSGKVVTGHRVGLACDWWGGRWKEDFDRAAESGQNSHRLSVEWSRIQPVPDTWNNDALEVYRQMLSGLRERGMTPMVTLHHFTDPLWLVAEGGWENPETPHRFEAYVKQVVSALKDYATLWCTLNEPNMYMFGGYIEGTFPPGVEDINIGFNVMANMVRGHARAYQVIHEIQAEARVGVAINYRSLTPARAWLLVDKWTAKVLSHLFNDAFPKALMNGKLNFIYKRVTIPEAVGTQDFFGVNYYTRDLVKFKFSPADRFHERRFPPEASVSDTGFLANVPAGLFEGIRWARQFKVPIMITENGIENADDTLRPGYLVEHLHQIWRAVNFNWPVKGYFHWTLVDNFEWERGWTQRFGLWDLDPETQTRTQRQSADLYETICKQNGISYETVQKYAPESLPILFPG